MTKIENDICNAMYEFMSKNIDRIKPFSTGEAKFIFKDYTFIDTDDMLLQIKSNINVAICCLYEILWCNLPKEFMWKTFMNLLEQKRLE